MWAAVKVSISSSTSEGELYVGGVNLMSVGVELAWAGQMLQDVRAYQRGSGGEKVKS